MTVYAIFQLMLFIGLLVIFSKFFGKYIANVFQEKSVSYPILSRIENACYKIGGVDENVEMSWKEYGKALLYFNLLGLIFLFLLTYFQGFFFLNPEHLDGVSSDLAFNIASSFTTNTNWQSYPGETTLSYLSQMLGLTSQNFLSASTGLCALFVLIRGISRHAASTVGNFWKDLTRSVVYIFLPLSLILSIFLVSQGVIQTFSPYIKVVTLEKEEQVIPLGPVASQVAIKQLGTNGGGFFNANGAHPFENPSLLTNFFETLAILLVPAALVIAYGHMVGSPKEGWFLFTIMLILFFLSLICALLIEHSLISPHYPQGSWEGKETRFGDFNSILWMISTTAASNGAVNAMLSSISPLAGGVALLNMELGEIIFGGVGVGLTGMIMFVILTVFLSGLMVGKTPEYLGKKIEKSEMQWVMAAILLPGLLILLSVSLTIFMKDELKNIGNAGPHGLSEVLYTFTSTVVNNGSAFSGFNATSPGYNIVLGILMILGRLSVVVPALAIGGMLAKKKITPPSKGTIATSSFIFAIMLMGSILIVGGLSHFPALSVGPILENALMEQGKLF